MLKSSGLSIQPCFTPWFTVKESVILPPILIQDRVKIGKAVEEFAIYVMIQKFFKQGVPGNAVESLAEIDETAKNICLSFVAI